MAKLRTTLLSMVLTLLHAGAAGAWPHSPFTNVPLCSAPSAQDSPAMVSDGAGGAIVAWRDTRNGAATDDIYARRVLASGTPDPAWPVNGRALCTALNEQAAPSIAPDGAGGAIVCWSDRRGGANYDIYVQHVLASGVVDPAWPVDGRALCIAASEQLSPTIVSDGAGGAVVAWQDFRSGVQYDIYAQRVLASGAVAAGWPADGRALCTATLDQVSPAIVSDGAGGAIVTWEDRRFGSTNRNIYAQRVLASGAVAAGWLADGQGICTATGNQFTPVIVADAAGGAIIGWTDVRAGPALVFAQRVLASGAVDPAWPANGQAPVPLAGGQSNPNLVPDGAGGAIVAWEDGRNGNVDIYAHRMLATGIPDPTWAAEGRALCKAASSQQGPRLASDGAGGAIVAWWDFRDLAANHIYAQRVLASGAVDPAWPIDGRAACLAAGGQSVPVVVSDQAGGVILAWSDDRAVGNADIYAQNITTFGVLGSPWPAITSIADLPNDQGGRVRIRWNASQFDTFPSFEIGSYGVWRQVAAGAAIQAIADGARLADADGALAAERGVYRAVAGATATTWWEGVGTVAARGEPWYTFVAETFRDSTSAGNPLTTFRVDAHALLQVGWWDSAPVSGYSVDNLAPATPAPFTGQYAAGTARLHWNRNLEYDLAGYRLYRGATASFVPGPGNLLAALPDTGCADAAGQKYVYKLTAVDVHGNESPVATLEFPGPTGVGDAATPRELTFAAPMPNPASAGTTLRYGLPRAASVRLAVYDASGRLVRVVASGAREAGDHAEAWDLRGADGRAAGAGLYFARLEVAGHRALVRRVAVTR